MMSSVTRSGYLFTASQWQELEHQALIYKYMVSGMPIPPDLLYTIRRSSLDTSLISSKLILNQPQHVGWNYLQLGFGKKIDPEPGRCRRTDGKKWRCSKEAYQESKYCERHMHRGRNRSRKPVEVMTLTKSTNTSTRTTSIPPTGVPISSSEPHHSFLYPHYSSSRPPGIGLSSDDHTKSLLDSGAYSRNSFDHGMKEEANKHVYYSEASGTMRSASGSSSIVDDSSWQLAPLTMGSPLGHLKQRTNYSVSQNGHSYLQLQSLDNEFSKQHHQRQDQYHYYALGNDVKSENMHMKIDTEDHQPKKVMHHFFDELPREDNKDSWLDSEDTFAKTHLSISVPNSSHDFFITPNGK